jgi:hypothetical protein
VALGTDTTGDYVASFTAGTGLSGDASGEGSTPTLSVNTASGITTSGDNVVLDVDFAPTWTNAHTWSLAETEDLAVNLSVSGTNSGQGQIITLTNSSSSGNQYGLYVENAASTGTTESLLVIDNSDTDTAVTNAIQFIDDNGGFTNLFNVDGVLISAAEFNVLDNEIALGSETSGNYAATIADAGNGTVSVTNGTAEGGAVTIDVIDLNCTNCIGPNEITDLTLGTDTAGNYVSSATASGGLALTGTEGASLGIDLSSADGAGSTGSGSGLEIDANGVGLLQGCAQGEILKWDNDTDVAWECATDTDTNNFEVSDGDKGDITVSGSGTTWNVDADSVALGTDTTGNFVSGATSLTGLVATGSENLTLGLDYSTALSGNVDLAANAAIFGQSGIIFEGATGGAGSNNELFVVVTDPTADRTITLPDASGTVILSGHSFTGGDVTGTLDTDGSTVLTVAGDSVALTTDTTGNYVSSATASGGLTLTGTEGASLGIDLSSADGVGSTSSGSGLELDANGVGLLQGCGANEILKWNDGTSVWACSTDIDTDTNNFEVSDGDKGDITVSGSGLTWNIDADSVALGTDTTGNFVSGATSLTGLVATGSENLTLGFDYSTALSGDPGLAANNAIFGVSGLIFEGSSANTFETFISVTNPTADRTITIPDVGGTIILSGHSFTGGDVTGTLDTDGTTALTIAGDSVALTTDTTGNYVSGATGSGGLTLTGTEGATLGIDLSSSDGAGATSSGSGMEIDANGVGLLQGCSDDQVLKWNESSAVWECGSDRITYVNVLSGDYTNAAASFTDVDDNATGNSDMAFAAGSNEEWIFQMNLQYSSNTTADGQFQITGPASSTCDVTVNDTEQSSVELISGCGVSSGNVPAATDAEAHVIIVGYVTTAGTAGSFQLQYRQNSASGTSSIFAGSIVRAYKISGADLAEYYYSNSGSLAPGTVVVADPALRAGVKKSSKSYENTLVGVVSTHPGLVLGSGGDYRGGTPVALALSGRVPVKVSTENGPIQAGDMLTSSSIPGVAMRATKAGAIIGQALTAYSGEGVGEVTVFIKTSYGTGSGAEELSGGVDVSSPDFAKSVLSTLMTHSDQLIVQTDLSEIVTDRLVAGLEIITPKLTANEVALNSIKAATAENIQINNDVVINGTLTVDRIKADQIEGLEVLAAAYGKLEQPQSTNPGTEESNERDQPPVDESRMVIDSATVTLNLSVNGLLEANGGLVVNGLAQFNGDSIFDQLVTFEGKSLFNGDAEFAGRATFNSDSGGFATIGAGQQEVRVAFDRPYSQVPVVTVNVKNGQFLQYAYKDLTENGFTIVLKDPAVAGVEFAWTALSVKDAEVSQN